MKQSEIHKVIKIFDRPDLPERLAPDTEFLSMEYIDFFDETQIHKIAINFGIYELVAVRNKIAIEALDNSDEMTGIKLSRMSLLFDRIDEKIASCKKWK